ncbi:MAG: histidine kinase dimerization/phosphoacceptor domain -containing protein, partial [Litorimonas sp.]
MRTRFGVLLALALLPWLLLTGLDAWTEFESNRISQSELADVVAANTVREVGRTLEAGRLGLEAAKQIMGERGCEAGAAEVLDRLNVYEALIVSDADGTPTCQQPATLGGLSLQDPDPFDPDTLFRIERGLLASGDGPDRIVVVLQRQSGTSGEVTTLILPEQLGLGSMLDATLGADSVLALTKPNGKGVIGMDTPQEDNETYRALISADEETLFDGENADGGARRIASRYFEDLNVYVTVGRTRTFSDIGALINPYTAVLLPILAWAIGFALIWAGTQTMLITPLRKVRGTARQFAGGRFSSRVNLSGSAATEVQGLANSFNRMALQIEEREMRLADNLDEKDTLMREIHHRVKNNLQIIISLLNMQERKAQSEDAIEAITQTRTRINAIAVVHRGLYESPDLRRIDIRPFVERLVSAMSDSLGTEEAGISLTHAVEPCHLSADHAIPIALFIVEAISNAAEHGVERGGSIQIAVHLPEPGQLSIEVMDDGCGVGDPAAMRGIGTKLMKGFARQLAGTLEFEDNGPGFVARMTLPIDDSP